MSVSTLFGGVHATPPPKATSTADGDRTAKLTPITVNDLQNNPMTPQLREQLHTTIQKSQWGKGFAPIGVLDENFEPASQLPPSLEGSIKLRPKVPSTKSPKEALVPLSISLTNSPAFLQSLGQPRKSPTRPLLSVRTPQPTSIMTAGNVGGFNIISLSVRGQDFVGVTSSTRYKSPEASFIRTPTKRRVTNPGRLLNRDRALSDGSGEEIVVDSSNHYLEGEEERVGAVQNLGLPKWYHMENLMHNAQTPFVISLYLQLLFNLILTSIVLYFVYIFISTISVDVNNKVEGYISEISQNIAACSRDYYRNECSPGLRRPALEEKCLEWEKCMNLDPNVVGRAKVGAETFAEIINGFVKPISWKSITFISLVVFGSLILTNVAFGSYRQNQLRYEAPYSQQAHIPPERLSGGRYSGHPSLPYFSKLAYSSLERQSPSPVCDSSKKLAKWRS
ncbi:hypothetical protein BABINDRAFT_158960 [Babjeviella inositovora NRRL Y-12698]|uniref:Brl1/Brr6 domain-containing protein n=1 Tax=Babjeviella inositovora NRRL Y-12698 TaxID=984486 RepID=A0A1E3QXF4_9ASCO|nr:uncharacterized protein BABINDRAFT_158960 [Babjeviella inositovora NRRL Y-12698]ODQ82343.1 hypothetical protein BABINDRAFT_158960 [Babjeviella inositovora NRRL Y-12698]